MPSTKTLCPRCRTACRTVLWLFDPRRTLSIACRRPTRAPTPKPADSSGSLHLAALDMLRAVSVLWLVAFHTYFVGRAVLNKTAGMEAVAGYAWAGPIVQGHYSVDGFLVVSGFLITRVIRREQRRRGAQLRLRRFFLRRLLRVVPGLLVVCGIMYSNDENCRKNYNLLKTITFVSTLWPVSPGAADICVTWSWSLALEVQFYFCIAALLVLLRGRPRVQKCACWGIIVGTFAYRTIIAYDFEYLYPPDVEHFGARVHNGEWRSWADTLYVHPAGRFGNIFCGALAALYYIDAHESESSTSGQPQLTEATERKDACRAEMTHSGDDDPHGVAWGISHGALILLSAATVILITVVNVPLLLGSNAEGSSKPPTTFGDRLSASPLLTAMMWGACRLVYCAAISFLLYCWLSARSNEEQMRELRFKEKEKEKVNDRGGTVEVTDDDLEGAASGNAAVELALAQSSSVTAAEGTAARRQSDSTGRHHLRRKATTFAQVRDRAWRCARYCCEHRVWFFISQISYSMYLLNPLAIYLSFTYILPDFNLSRGAMLKLKPWQPGFQVRWTQAHKAWQPRYMALAIGIAMLLTTVLALLLFLAVERPWMDIRDILDGRGPHFLKDEYETVVHDDMKATSAVALAEGNDFTSSSSAPLDHEVDKREQSALLEGSPLVARE